MEKLQSLVTRGRAGDVDAYGEIVRRFQDMGYGYAYSILGDFHLAEDAAQEAFIEAYRCLGNLREPAAFPGWFRRIIFKHCNRLTRRKEIPAASLEAAVEVASPARQPSQAAEDREMRDKVLAAIRSLPEQQREVTTLFYINGYSQNDIAEFLEVPAGTVKSRLAASRNRLKERMLNMVEETLHKNAPDERFSKKVIEELLARPRLLDIEGHPVREVYEIICQTLPDYEKIAGEEIVNKAGIVNPWTLQFAFPTDKDRILRTETTVTTFAALAGRTPPVRLITAGRVFRNDTKDNTHRKVFHSFDLVCIESDANKEHLKTAVQTLVEAVLGPVTLRYESTTLPSLAPCYTVEIKYQGAWRGLVGCGVFKGEFLREAGYDPSVVEGYALGAGLENLAMLKLGIDDIRKLWAPPYVPE